jgi:hypothetical protein
VTHSVVCLEDAEGGEGLVADCFEHESGLEEWKQKIARGQTGSHDKGGCSRENPDRIAGGEWEGKRQ